MYRMQKKRARKDSPLCTFTTGYKTWNLSYALSENYCGQFWTDSHESNVYWNANGSLFYILLDSKVHLFRSCSNY